MWGSGAVLSYPTGKHEEAAAAVVRFFAGLPEIDAVLQVGSCARGKASPDSCLDMLVLVRPEVLATERGEIERRWQAYHDSQPLFAELRAVGKYANTEVDISDGCFRPGDHGYTGGPDEFELEVGNGLVYSVPLWQGSAYLEALKAHWLPYYGEAMRRRRLAMVHRFGINNLDHIEPFVGRGLHFQAFQRLYDAYGEFLQALFIARRVYPIAYNKWIREQIEGILGLPELYRELPPLFEIGRFQSDELVERAGRLYRLYERYVEPAL